MSTEPESKPAAGAEGAAPAKAASPWPPVIAMVVLMPAISFAMAKFVIIPKIQAAAQPAGEEGASGAAPAHGEKAAEHAEKPAEKGKEKEKPKEKEKGHGEKEKPKGKEEKGKGGETGGKTTYDFENIVVNLAGSMGTRYLKTSFTVYSANAELKTVIEENKKQLLDVAGGVLGSRSLADLEQAGAKNVIRNDLMANFNEALKSDLIDQIYFSEFVIQ